MNIFGIILASGSSARFGSDKLVSRLGEWTVLEYTIAKLGTSIPRERLLVTSKFYGTNTRQETLFKAVEELLGRVAEDEHGETLILIHNGANPGVTCEEIEKCIEMAVIHGACGVAKEITDSIRMDNGEGFEALDRSKLYAMQTPQCIRLDLLLRGIEYARAHDIQVTDDLQLLDLIGEKYELIPASETNFKITTLADLNKMRVAQGIGPRMGVGQDSHKFADSGALRIGGIDMPDHPKLEANSDGDVVLHALFNAISSALGGGSLGKTADEMCSDGVSDSAEYLRVVLKKMRNQGYKIGNLSVSLECATPKIDPISDKLKDSLADLLAITTENIGITATSGEKLTPFGQGEGIGCICTVLLT